MRPEELQIEFKRLAAIWKRETSYLSVMSRAMEHEAMQQILALGKPVIPLIFEELRRKSDHWFLALHSLIGDGPAIPAQDRGRVQKMREHWLAWGEEHGYLPHK